MRIYCAIVATFALLFKASKLNLKILDIQIR